MGFCFVLVCGDVVCGFCGLVVFVCFVCLFWIVLLCMWVCLELTFLIVF